MPENLPFDLRPEFPICFKKLEGEYELFKFKNGNIAVYVSIGVLAFQPIVQQSCIIKKL
jgi:hypothetical protein